MSGSSETEKLARKRETPEKAEIARLQDELERERDARLEERFLWIVGLLILFDTFFFRDMRSWGGPIAVLMLEISGLIVLGKKCDVDVVEMLIDRVLAAVSVKRIKE